MGRGRVIVPKSKRQLREERGQGKKFASALIEKRPLDTVKQAAILQVHWKPPG